MPTPTTITTFTLGLAEEWRPGFLEAANEERVLTRGWFDGTSGAVKLKNKLYIRKAEAPGGSNVSTLGAASARADQLTTYAMTPTQVTVTPTYYYLCYEISPNVMSRLQEDGPKAKAAYRRHALKALATKIDTVGASQISSLSGVVGGAQNIDQALLAEAIQTLAVSAKDEFKIGTTKPMLTIINTQIKHLLQVAGFVQAHIRGSAGALKTGWVHDAYNVEIEESGNVATAAGIAHNPLVLPQCQVLAFNEEPRLWDPVPDGMATLLPSSMEFGVNELFDEYGVDVKTNG